MKKLVLLLYLGLQCMGAWAFLTGSDPPVALNNGQCYYQTSFNSPIPTVITLKGSHITDKTTPFFTTTMLVNYWCRGPLSHRLQFNGDETRDTLYGMPGIDAKLEITFIDDSCSGELAFSKGSNNNFNSSEFTTDIYPLSSGLKAGQPCYAQVAAKIFYYTNGSAIDPQKLSSKNDLNVRYTHGTTSNNFLTGNNPGRVTAPSTTDKVSTTGMNAFKIVVPSCSADIGMVESFASSYQVPPTPSGTEIVTAKFKIDLTCTPPVNLDSWNNESQLILGVGKTASAVQGITGVNAQLIDIKLDPDASKINCNKGVAQTYSSTDTTTTISTTNVAAATQFTDGSCTNHYHATVKYTTNGEGYAGTTSTQYLTDGTNDKYNGFLLPGTSLADLQVNSTLTSFSMQVPAGSCSAVINFLDGDYASNYKAVRSITNAPFLSKNVRVQLTCQPPLSRTAQSTQLVMGVGRTKSALLGGSITGVQASMTPFTLNDLASNCPKAFARALSQMDKTSTIGSTGAFSYTSANGTTCTNTYNATLNYYATGAAFSGTSSVNQLTDNVGTYRNFLKSGTYPGNVTFAAPGLKAFSVTNSNCRVVLKSKVRH